MAGMEQLGKVVMEARRDALRERVWGDDGKGMEEVLETVAGARRDGQSEGAVGWHNGIRERR